jgi:RNA 3'-terminal phosphate cyclase
VLAEELTGHAETNIWVIEKFLGKRFQTANKNGLVEIKTT